MHVLRMIKIVGTLVVLMGLVSLTGMVLTSVGL